MTQIKMETVLIEIEVWLSLQTGQRSFEGHICLIVELNILLIKAYGYMEGYGQ